VTSDASVTVRFFPPIYGALGLSEIAVPVPSNPKISDVLESLKRAYPETGAAVQGAHEGWLMVVVDGRSVSVDETVASGSRVWLVNPAVGG